jgi:amino acid adenylation domain-containing protein
MNLRDDKTLIARFIEQASRNPDSAAIRCGDTFLSYAELDRRSLDLARVLHSHGAGCDIPIAICLERSPEIIIAMLAVLRTGSAYLVLEPSYPHERRKFMLADSGAPLVIATAAHRSQFITDVVVISPKDSLPYTPDWEPPHENDLAYIIYTSGSTGKPKGVLCSHRGALNVLDDAQRRRPLGPGDACSWWTGPGFDVSVYEIFSPLISGATLVIVPDEIRLDAVKLTDWFCKEKITSAYIPPFMVADLESWVREYPGQSRLRRLLTGVEPIPERRLMNIARAVPEIYIINGYGPTEATIYCTCYQVDGSGDSHRNTPIGKALSGVEVFLFNGRMEPVADGEKGEIYIGGEQVARGYLNSPRLTAEHFLETPHGRLYRTGDYAVRLSDGNLMFAGREDQQIKFSGHRIELGEIESALCRISGVREAAVT